MPGVCIHPNQGLGKRVFPELSDEEAMEKLWDAIFKLLGWLDDPVKAWQEHLDNLAKKVEYLNEMKFKAILQIF